MLSFNLRNLLVYSKKPIQTQGLKFNSSILKKFSNKSTLQNEKIVSETWNNLILDINGKEVHISPMARDKAYENEIKIADLIGLGSGENGRIIIGDVDRFHHPHQFKWFKASRDESLHLNNKNLDEKREKYFKNIEIPTIKSTEEITSKNTIKDSLNRKRRRRTRRQPGQPNTYKDIPNNNIRKTIAKRLNESTFNVPHYYLTTEINMEKLIEFRKTINQKDNKITFNDIFIKSVGVASSKFSEARSQWHGDFIREFEQTDVAFAVDTGDGLITPIVSNVPRIKLSKLSSITKDLIKKSRSNKLSPNEYQGGTICISNLGMYDIHQFTSIINTPHSLIVSFSSPYDKLTHQGSDKMIPQFEKHMHMTVSCDHRVVDGAKGAQFVQEVKRLLENPLSMLV